MDPILEVIDNDDDDDGNLEIPLWNLNVSRKHGLGILCIIHISALQNAS
jgi:hypothetical protein